MYLYDYTLIFASYSIKFVCAFRDFSGHLN